MTIASYRKKPVVIEAIHLAADNGAEVATWCAGVLRGGPGGGSKGGHVIISTLEGQMTASPGDYVIRGVQGEFYPCKPDIFEATYEPADTHPDDHSDDELIVFPAANPDATGTDDEFDMDSWWWHRRDPGNHEIISHGEGYTRKDDAITGALRANPDLTRDQVQVRP